MLKQLEFYKDAEKKWRWRLRATNGKVIADSAEGYSESIDCLHGALLTMGGAYRLSDSVLVRNTHNGAETVKIKMEGKTDASST